MAPIAGRPPFTLRRLAQGAIAQLGERVVRNDEVGGSIPPGSTSLRRLHLLRLGEPYRGKAAAAKPAGRRRATARDPLPRKSHPCKSKSRSLHENRCRAIGEITHVSESLPAHLIGWIN